MTCLSWLGGSLVSSPSDGRDGAVAASERRRRKTRIPFRPRTQTLAEFCCSSTCAWLRRISKVQRLSNHGTADRLSTRAVEAERRRRRVEGSLRRPARRRRPAAQLFELGEAVVSVKGRDKVAAATKEGLILTQEEDDKLHVDLRWMIDRRLEPASLLGFESEKIVSRPACWLRWDRGGGKGGGKAGTLPSAFIRVYTLQSDGGDPGASKQERLFLMR